MSTRVGQEQKMKAKAVNLIDFMKENHPSLVVNDGKETIRLRNHHSVVIVKDGYFHNPSNLHHDGIELLMTFFEMTFQEAVRALAAFYDGNVTKSTPSVETVSPVAQETSIPKAPYERPLPSEDEKDMLQVKQYLRSRGIELTPELEKLIYPMTYCGHVNIVFASRDCRYAEIRGAYNPKPPMHAFKAKAKGSEHDGYFIVGDKNPDVIVVCESAIDAISYMLYTYAEPGCAYASIGGAGCAAAVARLVQNYPNAKIIIAFDNDEAGRTAAERLPYPKQFPNPPYKDWNEALTAPQGCSCSERSDGMDYESLSF